MSTVSKIFTAFGSIEEPDLGLQALVDQLIRGQVRQWAEENNLMLLCLQPIFTGTVTLTVVASCSVDLRNMETRKLFTRRVEAVFGLLEEREGQVVSKSEIAKRVFGLDDPSSANNSIEVIIRRLRMSLKAGNMDYVVHTLRGRGYMLVKK